ncbi:outer membrane protein assembly factor BamE domain-containing protein [Candidatus Pelagibacter sp. HIMB1623]|uniref:outer membrane protein assembly factor BamE domain-containing protein n=1 Tax=Candidatus Pelagibacter sp. HIMB1623 TaxID=3413358 RepID=UPI003F83A426
MKNLLYIILFSFIVSNCSIKTVVKHHGVPMLEKRQESLIVNKTNKNDIIKALGSPSTKSKFNNDIWIYIERKQTQSKLKNLGRMKIYENNVLVLEIDKYGLLKKKDLYNKDDMNNLKIAKNITGNDFKKNTFIYNFFSSLRQKINDPLNKRVNNQKKINQR